MRHAVFNPANIEQVIRDLCNGAPNFVEITTPSTTLTELKIDHGLGRVPKGVSVVKGDPIGSGTSAYTPAGTVTLTNTDVNTSIVDRITFAGLRDSVLGDVASGQYLSQTPPTGSFVPPRAGSITALSCRVAVNDFRDGNTTVTLEARVNGSAVYSITSSAIANNNDKIFYGTQAVGTDAFAAGDVLTMYETQSFSGVKAELASIYGYMEMSYDESGVTGHTYTASFTGTPASIALANGVTAGDTAWDANYMYLKFVATSAALTLAIW